MVGWRVYLKIFSLLLLMLAVGQAQADEVQVTARLAAGPIYAHVPFQLVLEVSGAEGDTVVDESSLAPFQPESLGASRRSQTSKIYDSGGWRTIRHESVSHSYHLVADRLGEITIPAIKVTHGGRQYHSQPLTITVVKPKEVADFKLRLQLGQDHCYVGQPLPLSVTWLVGADVKGYEFNLPFLADERLLVRPLPPASGGDTVQVTVAGREVRASRVRQRLGGRDYVAITFRYLIIPPKAGSLRFGQSSLTLRAQAGPAQPRSSRDHFGLFGAQPRYKTMVIPGNELALQVKELPSEGRPADFSGLVGRYGLACTVSPAAAKVGDPLRLTCSVSGDHVEHIQAHHLQYALPPRDFKEGREEPEESSARGEKSFTTTVRCRHPGVKELPSLAFSYFDPLAGQYKQARSEAVPLAIQATRVVTARDAQGEELVVSAVGAGGRGEGDGREELPGLRHNYWDISLSRPSGGGNYWFWLALFAGPLLAGLVAMVARSASNERQAAKRQVRLARRQLAAGPGLAQPFRHYLAARLAINPASITWHDVAPHLESRGVNGELREELARALTALDAARYGGGAKEEGGVERGELLALVAKLEEVLR
ncbi:MAG: BatD family protein [Thermodesulfobacteriota bacterium]